MWRWLWFTTGGLLCQGSVRHMADHPHNPPPVTASAPILPDTRPATAISFAWASLLRWVSRLHCQRAHHARRQGTPHKPGRGIFKGRSTAHTHPHATRHTQAHASLDCTSEGCTTGSTAHSGEPSPPPRGHRAPPTAAVTITAASLMMLASTVPGDAGAAAAMPPPPMRAHHPDQWAPHPHTRHRHVAAVGEHGDPSHHPLMAASHAHQ